MTVPSIQHSLVIDPQEPLITWHRRVAALRIETRIRTAGSIDMDPPGIAIAVEAVSAVAHE